MRTFPETTWLAADGLLLPESTLHSTWFGVLAAFVAINTVMYVVLAVSKILPKLYPGDWLPRTHARAETRSIYPDAGDRPVPSVTGPAAGSGTEPHDRG